MVAVKAALDFQASAILRLLHEVKDRTESKVPIVVEQDMENPMDDITFATSHDAKPAPMNVDALENVLLSVVTLATFHLLRSEFISLAFSKVLDREVAEPVSHELKQPVPMNLDALENVASSVVVLPTLHLLRSEFISPAA